MIKKEKENKFVIDNIKKDYNYFKVFQKWKFI
jgi:hypothetical protein